MIHENALQVRAAHARAGLRKLTDSVAAAAFLAGCIAAVLVASFVVTPTEAQATARGIIEYRLERWSTTPTAVDQAIADMGAGALRARWTRLVVDWSRFQPNDPTDTDPGYNTAYVEQLKSVSAKLEAAGINVILTTYLAPKWASNEALWNSPPRNNQHPYTKGKYYPFYAMHTDSTTMAAFQAMCTYLAKTLSPAPYGVRHFELGNEPNLYCYQYPQKRSGAPYFGASTYLKMLKKFYKGIKAADHNAVVIAGANSPRGGDDRISTSPQRFAKYLKAHGAAKYFDAYSHHPYHTGASRSPAPDTPPQNTRTAVTLYNIRQLLRLFPSKPFYLTEYGYSTEDMKQFGEGVTQVQQASYLRKAYAMVARHRQIKLLMWFLVQDTNGTYTGLREYSGDAGLGTRKLSWYAFAGGNSLTLRAPRSIRASRRFTLSGVLRGREGLLAGQRLQLQSRSPSRSAWKTLKSTRTRSDGTYSFASLKQKATRYYRVRWNGVCSSAKRKVRTP